MIIHGLTTILFAIALGFSLLTPPPTEICNCRAVCWTDESGLKHCSCAFEDCGGGNWCEDELTGGGTYGDRYRCVCPETGEPEDDCLCESGYEIGDTTGRGYPVCSKQDCTDTCCKLKDSEFPAAGENPENACDCRESCN